MASLARSLSTRVSRIEKPKPLKNIVSNRHSFSDKESFLQTNAEQVIDFRTPEIATRSGPEDVILMLEIVSSNIQNKDYSNISSLTNSLTSRLKNLGTQLEEYEEKLDKIFEIIRNGAHDISIDKQSRLSLMQLVELRASQWQMSPGSSTYYAAKSGFHPEVGEVYAESGFDFSQHQLLGPADVIKSSGKYNSPTRVPGKNYCKDEVVIRNSDSGKVMGIKGRRVHMIEELSETVISFQRVNPGAKERLVQITGPTEDKIIYAKNLIEDTIKRNASPVREIGGYREVAGSNSSINSSASDDSNWPNTPSGRLASNAASKESTEFKYSVHVLNDVIHISSTNLNLLNEAFSLLDSSYSVTEEISGLSTQHFSPSSKQDLHQNLPFSSSSKELPLHGSDLSHGFLTQYTREFLIDCSKSKAAQRPPANLALIAAQNPAIVKQSPLPFDTVAYQKRWMETDGKIASLPATSEDCVYSD